MLGIRALVKAVGLRSRAGWRGTVRAWWWVAVLGLSACAAEPRSTRLTVSDLEVISREMAASLGASEALASRGPQSPLWLVSFDRLRNLSSDVLSPAEQWWVIQRVVSSQPILALSEQRNLRFVAPARPNGAVGVSGGLQESGGGHGTSGEDSGSAYGAGRRPTHQLTGTLYSVTRATAEDRTELYYCEFVLVDLASGETVWTDKFEFKRVAKGHVWD